MTDTDIKTVQALVQRAFNLGEAYWRQADSESRAEHRRADETLARFEALKHAELPALIAQMQREAVQPVARMSLVRLDEQYRRALAIAIESGRASVSMIQRKLGIRYSQAQELVARMLRDGLVSIEDTPGLQHDAAAAPHPEAQALDSQLQQPDGHSVAGVGAGSYDAALHAAIMNLPCNPPQDDGLTKEANFLWLCGYRYGHHNARHAAAELVASTGTAGAQQQDDHAGSPTPSARTGHIRSVPGGAAFLRVAAQSSKAALSYDDARLSEDDLHARSWWCPICKKDVPPEMVTKDGEHYLEAGGCGYAVRGELIEDQPKQPLSDEEIDAIGIRYYGKAGWGGNTDRGFARAILARAGITRKPLTEDAICEMRRAARNDPRCVDQHWFVLLVRAVEQHHGITPQAGKESGDA